MSELPPELALRVGERRDLELPGLGTAGYRWDETLAGDVDAVQLQWQRGMSVEEARGRPTGASAPERLSIIAVGPGQVTVRLTQQRPWENGPPRAEHTIAVHVAQS